MQERIKKTLAMQRSGPLRSKSALMIISLLQNSLQSENLTVRLVSKPLEDLYPFLSREEFKKNMIIPIIDD